MSPLPARGFPGKRPIRAVLSHGIGLLALLFAFSPALGAEESGSSERPDRFMIRGGWAYVFKADTIFGINSSSGVSASVDFSNLLGGDRDDSIWRLDSLYRFNPRHSLGFSYYDVKRTGDRVLKQDVTIDDITYSAGGRILSEIDIELYRLFYNYSFVHDEKTELGLSFGVYAARTGIALDGELTCAGGPNCTSGPLMFDGSSTTVTIPLPSFAFFVNYDITRRLQGQGRLEWFYFETADVQGSLMDFYIGLEYRLFKHFALGAAFDRFGVKVDYAPRSDSGWAVLNNWNSAFVYGAMYF